jgi:hypothetical protein
VQGIVGAQFAPDLGGRARDLETGAQAQRRLGEEGLVDRLTFEPGTDGARLSEVWRPHRPIPSDTDADSAAGR